MELATVMIQKQGHHLLLFLLVQSRLRPTLINLKSKPIRDWLLVRLGMILKKTTANNAYNSVLLFRKIKFTTFNLARFRS